MTNDMTNFNRRIQNAIVLLVNRHGGEIHGSWFEIADLIQSEMGGVIDDEDVHLMRRHLQAVGLEHLTEGSPVAFFRMPCAGAELNLVDRRLLDVE